MIKKILNILILFSLMILNSCGVGSSLKNAVTGKTKPVGDEFLVEKKNPLSMPPDFDELPLPENSIKNESEQENETLKNKLKVSSSEKNTTSNNTSKDQTPSSIEKSILEKINN